MKLYAATRPVTARECFDALGLWRFECHGAAPPLVPASGVSPAFDAASSNPQAAVPRPNAMASQHQAAPGAAHQLFVETLACWLGGVWSDAQSIPEKPRAEDADRRCRAQETMYARRAGDRVKKDLAGTRQPGKLHADEAAAVEPLKQTKAFDALLDANVGDLSHEARAIAILSALDRMETARGLPKHLKVYAVGRPNEALLGVSPPEPPENVLKPLKGGAWLAYLSKTASAAGHPVPDRARSLTDRELLAWGGTLMGLGDKLRAETELVSDTTPLKPMLGAVVARLENEYRASQAAVLLEPEPAGRPHRYGPKPR